MLEGLKVIDLTWNVAGPLSTKCLADYGAVVVKLESHKKVDLLRTYPPYGGGKPGVNRSTFGSTYNSSKYSLGLDINNPKTRVIINKLIQWADVIVENFSPKAVARWGLDYESAKKINPQIIMVSASLQGQTGPSAQQPGLGTMMESAAGFTELLGWPDRPPSVGFAYTDYCAPWYVTSAVLAALDYRRREGHGLYFDLSQLEASLSYLSSYLLDYTVNGKVATRSGNQHPRFAPHAVYRCQGDDRWCAIAVTNEEEWAALCGAMGNPQWCQSEKFSTAENRKRNEDELNALLEGWTVSFDRQALFEMLQKHQIPCGMVQDGRDLHQDPQLAHRDYFRRVVHPEMGEMVQDSLPYRFAGEPSPLGPAPCLGEHTFHFMCEVLGFPEEDFAELMGEGVLE
ncbi:MAG: CoA transferase [Sterolibacterium sp.]